MRQRLSSSAHTGRASRSCQEAFGPYTSFDLHGATRRHSAWPWIVWAVLLVLLAVALVVVQS